MKGNFTYRLLYEKGINARYISQLDFVRVLNRTIRRSKLPVTYTVGFNPHPVMTVAAPIPVGTTSTYECMDIDFDEKMDISTLVDRFNATFPEGIRVLGAKLTETDTVAFRDIDAARYSVKIEFAGTRPNIDAFLALPEITVEKRTKKGMKEIDIKPDIYAFSLQSCTDTQCELFMELPAGNTLNIKPELVAAAMQKYLPNFQTACVLPHRTAILCKGKEIF